MEEKRYNIRFVNYRQCSPEVKKIYPRDNTNIMKLYTFKVETVNYQRPTNFMVNCNSVNFQNVGSTNASINQTTILPGDFYNVSGNTGEINSQQYFIGFREPNDPGNSIQVTTKVYTGVVDIADVLK